MALQLNPTLQPSSVSLPPAPTVDPSRIPALVHKKDPRNVFLTDFGGAGNDRFFCTGRMPVDHLLFNGVGRNPSKDILFYTEVGRQAGLAMTHLLLRPGPDDAFIFERSEAVLTEAARRMPVNERAKLVEVEVHVLQTDRRKNGDVCRVSTDHVMFLGGEQVFRGTGAWTIQPSEIYRRLRRVQIEISAANPGRPCVSDAELSHQLPMRGSSIVIGELEFGDERSEACAELLVDRAHPFFFDHPCDHVPGMLLLEGCMQIALQMASHGDWISRPLMVAAYEMEFGRFVEYGLPTIIKARMSGEHGRQTLAPLQKYDIVLSQRDLVSGVASITVGPAD